MLLTPVCNTAWPRESSCSPYIFDSAKVPRIGVMQANVMAPILVLGQRFDSTCMTKDNTDNSTWYVIWIVGHDHGDKIPVSLVNRSTGIASQCTYTSTWIQCCNEHKHVANPHDARPRNEKLAFCGKEAPNWEPPPYLVLITALRGSSKEVEPVTPGHWQGEGMINVPTIFPTRRRSCLPFNSLLDT